MDQSISYVNTKLCVRTCVLGILSVEADMQSTIARLSFQHAELLPVAICPIYDPPVASVITPKSSGGFECEMHTTPYPLHTTYKIVAFKLKQSSWFEENLGYLVTFTTCLTTAHNYYHKHFHTAS